MIFYKESKSKKEIFADGRGGGEGGARARVSDFFSSLNKSGVSDFFYKESKSITIFLRGRGRGARVSDIYYKKKI